MPRITLIQIPQDIINCINQMGKEEGENEGIVYTDLFENVTLYYFDIDDYDYNNDNSNVLDRNFELEDE